MRGEAPILKTLEGPGSEARLARLRRRFRGASRSAAGRELARLGKGLLILYWAACLAVILAGVDRLYPDLRPQLLAAAPQARLEPTREMPYVTATQPPARPFPNCAAAHAAGVFNIPLDSPAYRPSQDGDDDGFACEPPPY